MTNTSQTGSSKTDSSLARAEIQTMVPHAGAMCLIDRVEQWDTEDIVCLAAVDPDSGHPLARNGMLPLTALAEYGAQAMAVHGHLLAGRNTDPVPGFLVALARLELHGVGLDQPTELVIRASRIAGDRGGQVYGFRVCQVGGTLLADGQATVMFRDNPPAGESP